VLFGWLGIARLIAHRFKFEIDYNIALTSCLALTEGFNSQTCSSRTALVLELISMSTSSSCLTYSSSFCCRFIFLDIRCCSEHPIAW